MSKEIEQILGRELGSVAVRAGAPTGFGARLAAKLLKTKSAEARMAFGLSMSEARSMLEGLLQRTGSALEDNACTETQLLAVGRSGALNMNPVVFRLSLEEAGRASCTCVASAFAKEGLINQRTSEKAIARLLDAISKAEDRA